MSIYCPACFATMKSFTVAKTPSSPQVIISHSGILDTTNDRWDIKLSQSASTVCWVLRQHHF